jgi:hypothetical protein
MIFVMAKGEPKACGPDCSEWIAAEGMIDPGAAQRLRDFLAALPRRNLPIFFHSTGGDVGQAVALGAILREHRMSAGVGRTLPEGCRHTVATDEACRKVVSSKREHRARLVTQGARCLSACVYAMVGASIRRVAPDAQLGIHSARVSRRGSPLSVDEGHHLLKRYIIEMGVDPALIDAAAKVGADRVRFLSRDEIARFGIEIRELYETPWVPYEDVSKRFYVLKAVTQGEDGGSTEYRTRLLRVGCDVAGRTPFILRRELLPNEIGVASAISVAAGNGKLALDGKLIRDAIEVRYASSGTEFVRNAVAAPHIVVAEAFTPPADAPAWSRVIKFSTKGLSKALEELQKDCSGPKVPDTAKLRPER